MQLLGWLGLRSDSDMWQESSQLASINSDGKTLLSNFTTLKKGLLGGLIDGLVGGLYGLASLRELITAGMTAADAVALIEQVITALQTAQSLYTLEPIRAKLSDPEFLNPTLVEESGVVLRLATVGISRGQVRYINNLGRFIDTPGVVGLGLIDGVVASASIPAIFSGVAGPDDVYYDGGVRVLAPVPAAAEAGAATIYAVSASPIADPGPYVQASIGGTGVHIPILDLIQRATGLLTTEIGLRELTPPFEGVTATVHVVAPRMEVHDFLTIDMTLIRLSMDYG